MPPEDRLLTVPNVISVIRFLLVPFFVYLVYGANDLYGAALLLAVLGSTDGVDGYIARHYAQVSTFGKVFDPIADRALLIVAAVVIIEIGAIPPWVAALAIVRELIVSIVVVVLALAKASRIDVEWLGKAAAFGMMVALPLFLASHSNIGWDGIARVLAWVLVIPSLVLAYASLYVYVPKAMAAWRSARVGSSS